MKIAVMQPYLFPYIGYWQLIQQADIFVILDDVNYIRYSWMARNRFLCDGVVRYFHIPVKKASQNRLICDTVLYYDRMQRENLIKTFRYAYRKEPCLENGMNILENMFLMHEEDFTDYAERTLSDICGCLDIVTPIVRASALRSKPAKGQEGIIQICKVLSADAYINPAGGINLYDDRIFKENGIELSFLKTDFEKLQEQAGKKHCDLSIADLFCRFQEDQIKNMLSCCDLFR